MTAIPTIAQAQEFEDKDTEAITPQLESSLVLDGGERTRSQVVAWYLEELGISYQYNEPDIRHRCWRKSRA